jgi:hypothetical protein
MALPISSGVRSSYDALKISGGLDANALYITKNTGEFFYGGIALGKPVYITDHELDGIEKSALPDNCIIVRTDENTNGSFLTDIRVNGVSVVSGNLADIDLTPYATTTELNSKIANLANTKQNRIDSDLFTTTYDGTINSFELPKNVFAVISIIVTNESKTQSGQLTTSEYSVVNGNIVEIVPEAIDVNDTIEISYIGNSSDTSAGRDDGETGETASASLTATEIQAMIDAALAATAPSRATTGDANYTMNIVKYPDGFMSGYGTVQNAGVDSGIVLTLPDGFSFKDGSSYSIAGTSAQGEVGGAVDSLKILDKQSGSFTIQTVHLEESLELSYTSEVFSYLFMGDWK